MVKLVRKPRNVSFQTQMATFLRNIGIPAVIRPPPIPFVSCSVVSYLMQKRGLKVTDALKAVRLVRRVNPNKGFMQQLIDLHHKLHPL